MTTLFISDLHLHASRPQVTACFVQFLESTARTADALYILGDLFEVWIGDDDPDPDHASIARALAALAAAGTPCYLTRGNRDFLIGNGYVETAGMTLLPEIWAIDLYSERVLLMHGDELCTDDRKYQWFRRIVRNSLVQWLFARIPLGVRRRIADRMRRSSKETEKPDDIMDVNQNSVENMMRHAGVRTLIHGHTHRPAIHRFSLGSSDAMRVVLGDWYTQGSVLHWDADGPDLRTLPIASR
jgi:UDP-2,3-diacylglucosamine hydrolase